MKQPCSSSEVVDLHDRDAQTFVYDSADAVQPRQADEALIRPTKIGRYTVLEPLGSGGMGQVWAAYDPKLDRKVALKLIRNTRRDSRQRIHQARLLREAQALAKLSHPNVVTVHDVDTAHGRLYMAMEFVEGPTVSEWIERERPDWRAIVQIYVHAGRGLAAAHAQDITHRDVKPSNIVIGTDGRVRVLDFGLAKDRRRAPLDVQEDSSDGNPILLGVVESASGDLTQAGRVLGTPAFMAPEQHLAAGKVSHATDQFSLAVSLYDSLYDQFPFDATTLEERYKAIVKGKIQDPPKDSDVPPWVLRVLRRALAARPADRYASMDAFIDALEADPRKRRRRILGIAGIVALGLLGTTGVVQAFGGRDSQTICNSAPDQWTQTWNDRARDTLGQAFAATEVSYASDSAQRVGRALDDYGHRWMLTRTHVCEATRVHEEQSEALLDVRMACLDERRREVEALINVLQAADATVVERAVSAVYGLRGPVACQSAQATAATELPTDAAERREALAIRALIDDATASMSAGRYDDAVSRAREATERAKGLDHGPTTARALMTLGRARRFHDDFAGAVEHLRAAVEVAALADDPQTEALAWINLIYVAGVLGNDIDTADAWRLAARTAVNRAGKTDELTLGLRLNEAAVALRAGRFDEAQTGNERVIEIGRGLGGDKNPDVITAWMNLGIIAAQQHRLDEAEHALQQALDLDRAMLGPNHPRVADAALNLGNVLLMAGQAKRAQGVFADALSAFQVVYGPHDRRVAQARISVGVAAMHLEQWDDAERELRRAHAALRDADAVDLRVKVLNNLGLTAVGAGHPRDAIALHEEALRELELNYGADAQRPLVARTKMRLCTAHAKLPSPAAAAACERAQRAIDRVYDGSPHAHTVEVQRALASIHAALGHDDAALEAAHRRADQTKAALAKQP